VDLWLAIEDRLRGKRVLILGIGNKMRGDDGAGSELAAQLAGRVSATVIDAEEVPENYLGPVIADNPEVLLILDAASMDAAPGSLAIIEMDNIAGSGLSTHSASLNLFLLVLQSEIQPDTFILGVQPQNITFGAPISQPVSVAMEMIEKSLIEMLPMD